MNQITEIESIDATKRLLEINSDSSSFEISDSDLENYFLEDTADNCSEISMIRCTKESINQFFYTESCSISDYFSLIQGPNNHDTTTESFKKFLEQVELEQAEQSDRSDSSCELPAPQDETVASKKISCKTICSNLANKVMTKLRRRKPVATVKKEEKSTEKEITFPIVIRHGDVSHRVYTRNEMLIYENLKYSSVSQSPMYDEMEENVEKTKNNFNKPGDIVYYYV